MGEAALRWLEFATCAAVIGIAGARLTRYGDAIAAKTGLSGSWIGLVLVATVTSFPETVTGASAAVGRLPDIAVGNVLGACVLDLAMLALLDFLHRGESVYSRASQAHIRSAGFVMVMLGFTGLSLLAAEHTADLSLGNVGLASPVLVTLYALAIRMLWRYERTQVNAAIPKLAAERYADLTLRQVVARYAIAAGFIVAAGIWLPFAAARLAAAMRWGETFVGTLFVSLATTLPELSVAIAAARIGAIDLGIANLLGSALYNPTILALDDLLFVGGPILAAASRIHAMSAMSGLLMAGIVVVGLRHRPRGRVLRTVGSASIALAVVYVLNTLVLYLYAG